jgi:NAD(P)-dependent dehydrogenase (short-subunit alcohol dehydrogenase family)
MLDTLWSDATEAFARCERAAPRRTRKKLRQGGQIVNFSSSVARLGFPGYSVYAATKSAVETMTNIGGGEWTGFPPLGVKGD